MRKSVLRKLAFISLLFISSTSFSQIIYVNASAGGLNDGTSWTDAYANLETALSAAVPGDEIWVAFGTYVPSTTFNIPANVQLYGGFSGNGTETSINQRDLVNFPTTLTGDVLADDAITTPYPSLAFNNRADNRNQVVSFNNVGALSVLDGFVISGGGSDIPGNGGAMSIQYSSPTIRNVLFELNSGANGGAVNIFADNVVNSAAPTFINCVFTNNIASTNGGAIYISSSETTATTTIINSTFSKNTAVNGGAIYNTQSTGTIVTNLYNSIFYDNLGTTEGLSLFNQDAPTVTITLQNSLFEEINTGGFGGTQASVVINDFGGNLFNQDPLFINPSIEDLGLQAGSPAGNSGNNSLVPIDTDDADGDGNVVEVYSIDINGKRRDLEGAADMGAIETLPSTMTVLNANDQGNESLREAIANVAPGGTILFDPSLDGTPIVLQSTLHVANDMNIDGAGQDIILSGDADLSGTNNAGDTQIMSVDESFTVEFTDITFEYGYMDNDFGGALLINAGANVSLTHCTFRNNAVVTSSGGAAIASALSDINIEECLFMDNTSIDGGAAIYQLANGGTSINANIFNSTFINNQATNTGAVGGAIVIGTVDGTSATNTTIYNCTFDSNTAEGQGGAVFLGNSAVLGTTNTFFLSNNTFHNNNSITSNSGDAIYVGADGTLSLYNTIVANTESTSVVVDANGTMTASSNNIITQQPSTFGAINTVTLLPSEIINTTLITGPNGIPVLEILANGLAYDAGTNTQILADVLDLDDDANIVEDTPIDAAGNPRAWDALTSTAGTVDIGATESQVGPNLLPLFLDANFTPNINQTVTSGSVPTIVFDLDVDLTSAHSGTNPGTPSLNDVLDDNIIFTGEHSGRIFGTYSQLTGTDAIDFLPSSTLKAGETITISVTDGVQGTGGEIAAPFVYQYSLTTSGSSPGNILPADTYAGTTGTQNGAVADLNGDGFLDVFTISDSQGCRALINDGSGGFTITTVGPATFRQRAIALGDIDNDGDIDAFIGIGSTGNPAADQIWKNDGTGTFTLHQTLPFTSEIDAVALGDLDGDGDLDAFQNVRNGSNDFILLNDGNGTYTDSGQTPVTGTNGGAVALGDVDNDGDLDAFIGQNSGGTDELWINDGNGVFTIYPQTFGTGWANDVVLGDFDGDFDLDVFISTENGENDEIWRNSDGTGNFVQVPFAFGNVFTSGADFGDIDGDGTLDILSPNGIWTNDGSGNYTSFFTGFSGTGTPIASFFADFDNDFDLDPVIIYGDETNFYFNNPPPPLAPTNLIAYESGGNIVLEWFDNASDETGFIVERADDFAFTTNVIDITSLVGNPGVDATTATFDPSGVDYYYRVTAANGFEDATSQSSVEFASPNPFPGQALSFDGTDDNVETISEDNTLDFSTTATFEFWINRSSGIGADAQTIIDKTETGDAANFRIGVNESSNANPDQAGIWNGGGTVLSTITVTDGEWKHIAVVISGGNVTFYENGNLVDSYPFTLGAANDGLLLIGTDRFNPSGRAFNGQLDEIRIWNDARTQPEIQANLYNSLQGNEANLVAYYPFDEGAGLNIVDRSRNINDGVLTGSPVFSTSAVPIGPDPFITTWVTSDGTITIPTTGTGYNYDITWTNLTNATQGDGSDTGVGNSPYLIPGLNTGDTYEISISGDFPRIFFNDGAQGTKIQTIEQWGDIQWTSMEHSFHACSLLVSNAIDAPDLSQVTSTQGMFIECINFNADITAWDMSNVVNTSRMFFRATSFNNGDPADNAARPLTWGSATSNFTNISDMFMQASSFNQDISDWDVGNVSNFNGMFSSGDSYNNGGVPLTWTTIGNGVAVITMETMFNGASVFNQPIAGWDVSKVTSINSMFRNTIFDQDISSWNTGAVTNMFRVFEGAQFNQDISTWNVSNVVTMNTMFNGVGNFDQNLGAWDISSITDMEGMFRNAGLSPANYSATLSGWLDDNSGTETVPTGISLGALNVQYECAGTADRLALESSFDWTIDDAGPADLSCLPTLTSVSIGMDPSGNPNYVAPSDIIDIAITASEDITNVSASLFSGGNSVTNSAPGITGSGTSWNIRYAPTGSDTEGIYTFTIDFENLIGIPGAQVTSVTDGSFVILDLTEPVIISTSISADNSTLTVDFDEDIFSDSDGLTDVILSNFLVTNSGGLASVSPTSINILSGSQIEIGLSITGDANGEEMITVEPNVSSVYNAAGLAMLSGQSNNTVNLIDNTAPIISGLSTISISDVEADFDISIDDEGTLFYVLTESAIQPSAAQIVAGQDENSVAAFSADNFNIAAPNQYNFNVSGLSALTTYHIYWIAEDASMNQSNILTTSFTTPAAPVGLTFTSIAVPSIPLRAGTNDNLIYQVQMDVSVGTATMIGMFFTPDVTTSYAESDFVQFNFYESRGVDDFASATPLGSNVFFNGDPQIPDGSVGLYFASVYTDETVYWYVTADIDAGADVGNTFRLDQPTLENFGINEEDSKTDNGLAPSNEYTIESGDTTSPTLSIMSAIGDPTNISPIEVDIIFDEEVVGFELDDITVDNGTLANFIASSGNIYSVEVTPTEDGAVTVDVAAGVAQDLAGNDNIAGMQFSITSDQTSPTVAISSTEGDPTNTSPIVVAIAFNEVVTGFELTDVTVGNGTASNLVDVDGQNYTVDITPTTDGIVTIDIGAAVAQDAAGNDNTAATQFSINYSTTGPDITLDQDGLTVNDTNLSGTIENTTDVIQLSLDGGTTLSPVSNEGDGTWSYDLALDPNFDGDGLYAIYLDAVDVLGNQTIENSGTVTIDQTAPIVTVDVYGTSITSPQVTGTIDDNGASIEVTVAGNSYTGTNNGDGTWVLAAGMISPALSDGTYDVEVTVTDAVGNVGTDDTIDELTISQTVIAIQASNLTSTSFRANWSEGLDVDRYQLDVSTTADFSTFVTGFENFETTATNTTIANLDFGTRYYYRVRVVNTASEVSDNSNTITAKTSIDLPTVADSLALTQVYAAINPQGLNWTTERLRNWDGVTLDASKTRVSVINISGTQSSGDMPNPFSGEALTNGGLSAMTAMDVSDNALTGLMDFTGTSLSTLFVNTNNLQFDDLEPLTAQGITNLDYSDQATVNYNQTTDGSPIEVRHLNDYVLSIGVDGTGIGGSSNVYTWYRNDEAIVTNEDFGISNAEAVIVDIDYDNMGVFRTEVTSTLVPNLTIEVEPQTVWAVADIVMTLSDGSGSLITGEVFDAALMETIRGASGYDTLERALNASSEFVFEDVVLGDYLCGVEPEDFENYIPTYFGNQIEWGDAEPIALRADATLDIVVEAVPLPPTEGDGNLNVLIEDDFGDESSRIDARRRAAKRKCGLRRKRSGGRTGQDDDEFELIAYGETDENGEFEFGFLPQGTYRFFVEYPGIPLDESSEVEFEVGEAGISDTDFKLEAFATEDGLLITIDAVLGVILEYFKDLQIYPNPSSEYVNIRYRHLKSEDVTAELIDLSGNRKWSQELSNGYNGEIQIDVSDFNEGVYLLRFYDNESRNENVVTYRIMVRK